jgi:hypothetical protein
VQSPQTCLSDIHAAGDAMDISSRLHLIYLSTSLSSVKKKRGNVDGIKGFGSGIASKPRFRYNDNPDCSPE